MSCPGLFLWPALSPATARVDLCETTGEVPAASADIVSPRLTAHTARSCMREASSVDVACQEVPVAAAFSPQEREKKKKDAHISSTSLLRTKAVRGATTPIKGRKSKGAGAHLGLPGTLYCCFFSRCVKLSWGEEVDRGRVSCRGVELARPL